MSIKGRLSKLFFNKGVNKQKNFKNHYLIEFRFIDRELKKQMKNIESSIHHKFGIGQKHFVPHITLVGGFETENEKKLLTDFYELCSKAPMMKFTIKGFSTFEDPKRVVFFDIEPSEELKLFRWNLSQKVRHYCSLKKFDFNEKDEFIFHSTVSINIPPEKFHKIKNYVNEISVPLDEHYLVRATLIKNDKIFHEYDFFQKKLLMRDQARSPEYYQKTQDLLDEFLKKNVVTSNIDIRNELYPGTKNYLISDLHLDHENIIRYCSRNFKNTKEMNDTLVKCWNDTIKNSDNVYFLGDLRWGRNSHTIDYWLKKLKGKIVFIKGSHDNEMTNIQHYETYILKYRDKNFLLIHNPDKVPKEWTGWVIHGHHHNNKLDDYPFINGERKTINVSAELLDYNPLDIEKLFSLDFEKIKYMKDSNSKPEYY